MLNMTDAVVRLAILYFAVRGFFKGFLQTLIPPISLLVGLVTSFYFYSQGKDLFKTMLVSIICPIVVNILLSLSLKFWKTTFGQNASPSWGSRTAGALVSVFWSGIYLALCLILIVILPDLPFEKFRNIQKDVSASQSYQVVKNLTQNIKPLAALNTKDVFEILQNPEKMQQVEKTEEFKQLLDDRAFKEFLSDPEIATQLQNQDINSLMNNPQFQALLRDQNLFKKILALDQRIIEEKNREIESALKGPAENGK